MRTLGARIRLPLFLLPSLFTLPCSYPAISVPSVCLSVCLCLWISQFLFLLVFPWNSVSHLFSPSMSPFCSAPFPFFSHGPFLSLSSSSLHVFQPPVLCQLLCAVFFDRDDPEMVGGGPEGGLTPSPTETRAPVFWDLALRIWC